MGGAATGISAFSTVAQGASSFASSYAQATAAELQGDFQKSQYEANAKFSELRAEDAIRRGDREAIEVKKAGKRVIGSQRAALAAQGIEVDSGTAVEVQADTAGMAAEDALRAKNNAWREAWGYRVEAANARGQGRWAAMAAENTARSTLVTGGLKAATQVGQGVYEYAKGRQAARDTRVEKNKQAARDYWGKK